MEHGHHMGGPPHYYPPMMPPPPHFYPPMPPPPPQYFCPPPPRRWTPWLVPLIFLADTAMFVYTMYLNDCPATTGRKHCIFYRDLDRFSFEPLQENILFGPRASTLQELGALEKEAVVGKKEIWRLFSCTFLHAGVIHLIPNMFSLLFTGFRLEKEFGFLRIGILYVLAGFGGSLTSVVRMKSSDTPGMSVGASGAIFGLLGAMLSELITNWTIYTNKCAAFVSLIIIVLLNLALGLLPNVDSSAHIGGFVSGFFLGFLLLMRAQYGYVSHKYLPPGYHASPKSRFKCYQYFLFLVSLIVLLFGYSYGLAKLYNKPTPDKYIFSDKHAMANSRQLLVLIPPPLYS